MKHIHTLTGLRGLAALIVFISHSANESILPSVLGNGFGQVGVMLFFVLSGFLIAHLYADEDFNGANIKKYLLARIGRVVPLYFLLVIISVIVTKCFSVGFYYKFDDVDTVARTLLFIDAPYVFWTIPVEVQFYMAFLGFWLVHKNDFKVFHLVAFVVFTMVPSVVLYLRFAEAPDIVSSYSYAFFLGSVTALLFGRIKDNATVRRLSAVAGLPALLLLFVNLPVLRYESGLVFDESFYLRTWGDPLTWVIVYVLFICAILNSKSLAVLTCRPLLWLGDVSYGFYLLHYPVLMYVKEEVDAAALVKFALAFSVTVCIAHLSFYCFEKPAGKIIRNLAQT